MTYLLTFNCYGTHPPGDQRGSVDRGQHRGGRLPRSSVWNATPQNQPYKLDHLRAGITLTAIHGVCAFRTWELLAAHARTTHARLLRTSEPRTVRLQTSRLYQPRPEFDRKPNAKVVPGCDTVCRGHAGRANGGIRLSARSTVPALTSGAISSVASEYGSGLATRLLLPSRYSKIQRGFCMQYGILKIPSVCG